jgi:hypothetical protein
VTDDRGRYLIPDLPKANYSVFRARLRPRRFRQGQAAPGKTLNLTQSRRPTKKAAAEYYPPIYWFSMLHVPVKTEFPVGRVSTQGRVAQHAEDGRLCRLSFAGAVRGRGICRKCSATNSTTRRTRGRGASNRAARRRRWRATSAAWSPAKALTLFADWTTRIDKGELPFAKPERPDRHRAQLSSSANGIGAAPRPICMTRCRPIRAIRASMRGQDLRLARKQHRHDSGSRSQDETASEVKHPVRDPKTPNTKNDLFAPSAVWGDKPIWDSQAIMHNPMMDEKGHVWFTARIRPARNPDFCKAGSSLPSAKAFPLDNSGRQVSMYDPASGKFALISTCFTTHHLNFRSTMRTTRCGSRAASAAPASSAG